MSRIPKLFGGFKSILTLLAITLVTALIIIPGIFNVADASIERTRKIDGLDANRLPKMYDIRDTVTEGDVKDDVSARLEAFRSKVGTNAVAVADIRDGFVRGEESLKQRIPNIKIEYNNDIRIPEVISPKMDMNHIEFLTGASGGTRAGTLKNFLKENNELIGVSNQNIDGLKVGADYLNPDGSMAFARLEQEINGIPVFRGEVNAGFTNDGRMVRIINNLAPGIDESNVSTVFGDSGNALAKAAEHIGVRLDHTELSVNAKRSTESIIRYGKDDWAPTAEKMYFPTEPGVAVPAWRVLIWRGEAYYVIVEAETQTVLWHKNISDEQTQPATYQVYTNAPVGNAAFMNVADSVMPLSPYISTPANDPTQNAQGTYLARSNVTLIGNEGANSFNTNGWITDGANVLDGNNTEAGSDMITPNGVDFPEPGDAACPGPGCRVFTSAWIPQPGGVGETPQEPFTDPIARRGANIQMFYVMNLYHDELYKVGFNEVSRNFQALNFGLGGVEGDRVSSEGQDQTIGPSCGSSPCLNNANFATPADGGRGRMQMYLWSGHTPRRDGTGDAEIIIHEVSHGTSNRLIGNGSGLGNMGSMMGEGWGDWYASTLLAQATDGVNGIHALSGYSTSGVNGLLGSYYYGIRRFPTAVISLTGGPNNPNCNNGPCPHNPLTFKHINAGCDTTLGTTTAVTSAFRRNPVFGPTANCSQVHNAGEIWKSALWEVRARMVSRLGFLPGTTRVLQAVTSGMKLTPVNPNFLQARDGVIAAAAALSFTGSPELSADIQDVREGFRVRGMGFSASVTSSSVVTEAFDTPNVGMVDPFSVAEAPTGNDGDGFPEPGENVLLSIAVRNPNTGAAITNVQVSVNGGANFSYGTIADGVTVTNQVPYTVPAGALCGSMHQVTISVSSTEGSQVPVNKEFRLGAPVGGAPASFTNNTPIDIPNGQPASTGPGAANPYPSTVAVSGLTGAKVIKVTLNNFRHEFEDDVDMRLVGPGGQALTMLSDTGGTTEQLTPITFSIADNGATLLPDATAFVNGTTYRPSNVDTTTDAFPAPAPAGTSAAPAGTGTFASVFGTDGAAMNGNWSLYVFDDAGADPGRIEGGWTITFEANDFTCGLASNFDVSGRVVNSAGRGIGNAVVTMTGGGTRVVRTSSFGYFSFVQVPGSVQYTIAPSAKRFTFTPQQVTPTGNISNLVFTGTP